MQNVRSRKHRMSHPRSYRQLRTLLLRLTWLIQSYTVLLRQLVLPCMNSMKTTILGVTRLRKRKKLESLREFWSAEPLLFVPQARIAHATCLVIASAPMTCHKGRLTWKHQVGGYRPVRWKNWCIWNLEKEMLLLTAQRWHTLRNNQLNKIRQQRIDDFRKAFRFSSEARSSVQELQLIDWLQLID